jgi:WD40 repeat protein
MRRLLIPALILLAACAPTTNPNGEPTATGFLPAPRNAATLTPVPWAESGDAISLSNVPSIQLLGRLETRVTSSTVFANAFSPDGVRLAGLTNEQVVAWDLINGNLVFGTARENAEHVYYSPDKTEIFTLDSTGQVHIYNADSGEQKNTFIAQQTYRGTVAYDADDGWLALGGVNGEVKVWDVAVRQSLVTIKAHTQAVTAIAFSPDGTKLATAGRDNRVQVWDWKARNSLANLDVSGASRLAFSPDGARLAAGMPNSVSVWTVATGKLAYNLSTGPGGSRDVLAFSPDRQYILTAGEPADAAVWDAKTGAPVNTLPGVGGDTVSAAFSPDGTLLATVTLTGKATLWNMGGIREKTLQRADLNTTQPIAGIDWTPDSHLLALFTADGPVQMWGLPVPPATATPTQSP